MGFIPLTNFIIFNNSKLVNIESIRYNIHAIHALGKVWIPLSIISVVHDLSTSNKNLLNPSVTCNISYCISINRALTTVIGMIDVVSLLNVDTEFP